MQFYNRCAILLLEGNKRPSKKLILQGEITMPKKIILMDNNYIDLTTEKQEQVQKHIREMKRDMNLCTNCNTKLIKNICRFCGKVEK